ncbi:MAG: hypothetical protein VB092_05750 [Oscillospiraceae bacterium]|nr:hypothetical protein [Oscillospiraceae bacterium]
MFGKNIIKPQTREVRAAQPAAAPGAGVPAQVVAAIAAAVAAVCGEGAAVRSIRPAKRAAVGRSAWSTAGLLDNTRAF